MELVTKLRARESDGNPVAVGVVGCGQMGSGLAHTLNSIEGMAIRAIADIEPQRGIDVFAEMGYGRGDVVVTDKLSEAQDAARAGKRVVTADALILPALDALEANVEATGLPDIGALVAWNSINNRKPVVMLNVETDVTVGLLLNDLARRNDTVYTVASGDEPGVLKMLWEQATLMGFEVVCLGKGKNNTINFEATEDTAREEALSKDMNPKILAAFQDGTKTMVELAAVSNATGLVPDVTGMHGAKADVEELTKVFIPKEDGGIFGRRGCVDFSTGRVAPGVFAIVHSDEPRIRKDMKFITKADGPYYLHFRPYHLCDLETPQSVAEAVLLGERTITSAGAPLSEVVCVAKRDLAAGQTVEGIGGHDWYGTIMTREEYERTGAVPMGIGTHGRVTKDVRKGEVITADAFEPDTDAFVYKLRELQEGLVAKGALS
ncbi:MAG: NAD(P)H-dependent oxidoreductase [Spirochaetota bacterium]